MCCELFLRSAAGWCNHPLTLEHKWGCASVFRCPYSFTCNYAFVSWMEFHCLPKGHECVWKVRQKKHQQDLWHCLSAVIMYPHSPRGPQTNTPKHTAPPQNSTFSPSVKGEHFSTIFSQGEKTNGVWSLRILVGSFTFDCCLMRHAVILLTVSHCLVLSLTHSNRGSAVKADCISISSFNIAACLVLIELKVRSDSLCLDKSC